MYFEDDSSSCREQSDDDSSRGSLDPWGSMEPPEDEEFEEMLLPYSHAQKYQLRRLVEICQRSESSCEGINELIVKVKAISPRPSKIVEIALSDAIGCNTDICQNLIQEFEINLSQPITERKEDSSHCDVFQPYPRVNYVKTHPLFIVLNKVFSSMNVMRRLVSAMFSATPKPDFEAVHKGKSIFQTLIHYYKLDEETLQLFLSEPNIPRAGIWPDILRLETSLIAHLAKDARTMEEMKKWKVFSDTPFAPLRASCDEAFAILLGHADFPIEAVDDTENTIMHHLAKSGMANSLEALLKRDNSTLHTKNNDGMTPLDLVKHVHTDLTRGKGIPHHPGIWVCRDCMQRLEKSMSIPEIHFRVRNGFIVSIHKEPCMAASDYIKAMFTTQIGDGPPEDDVILVEDATVKQFEFIKHILEGHEWKIQVYQWRKTFIMPIVALANKYLFTPVQLFVADLFLRNEGWLRPEWTRSDDCKENLIHLFLAWYAAFGNEGMPETIANQFQAGGETMLRGALEYARTSKTNKRRRLV